jgi:hypothetical protein
MTQPIHSEPPARARHTWQIIMAIVTVGYLLSGGWVVRSLNDPASEQAATYLLVFLLLTLPLVFGLIFVNAPPAITTTADGLRLRYPFRIVTTVTWNQIHEIDVKPRKTVLTVTRLTGIHTLLLMFSDREPDGSVMRPPLTISAKRDEYDRLIARIQQAVRDHPGDRSF